VEDVMDEVVSDAPKLFEYTVREVIQYVAKTPKRHDASESDV